MTRFRFNAPGNYVLQLGDKQIKGGEEFSSSDNIVHPDVERLHGDKATPTVEGQSAPAHDPEAIAHPGQPATPALQDPGEGFAPKVTK